MNIDDFLAPKIVIVSGKGGVGKTTVSAALALVAARHGRKVCLAEVDRKGSLARLFGGQTPSYKPAELAPGVWGLNIPPDEALAEYLKVQYHMNRISRVFKTTHFVDFITTAAPGLKDILVLGKIWYLEQDRSGTGQKFSFDTIIVDAPAAGHMLTFLSAPLGLSDAVRVGPIKRQADWLVEMLRDPKRTRAHLVTLPEEMPVSETLETSDALSRRLRINQGALFANAIYPRLLSPSEARLFDEVVRDGSVEELVVEAKVAGLTLDADDQEALTGYARFVRARRAIQNRYLDVLRSRAYEPVVELPFLFAARPELPDIEMLADAIEDAVPRL
jgi:anion-transporting  ArsA/GET3 family ATPase